jgi:hypothetical protein
MAKHDDDADPKQFPDLRLTRRGREIALMLSQVSNPTIPRDHRESIADALAWELGENETTESAWNFAVSVRLALGYSPDPKTCWQQIVQKNYPTGEKVWRIDWLRVAGFLLEDGTENLPDAKRAAPGAKRRLSALLADFCRQRGIKPGSAHEIADDRKPYVDD